MKEKLKYLREYKHIKQSEMADLLNISQQHYSLYENERYNLRVEQLKAICLKLNVSADYLLDLPQNMPYPKYNPDEK